MTEVYYVARDGGKRYALYIKHRKRFARWHRVLDHDDPDHLSRVTDALVAESKYYAAKIVDTWSIRDLPNGPPFVRIAVSQQKEEK